MKKITKIILILLILAVAAFVSMICYNPTLSKNIKSKVSSAIYNITRKSSLSHSGNSIFVPLYQSEIGYDSFLVKEGFVKQSGMFMSNPKSFKNKNIIEVDNIEYSLDLNSLSTDTIVIDNVTIDGFRFFIEDSDVGNNIEVFVKQMLEFVASKDEELKSIISDSPSGDIAASIEANKRLTDIILGDLDQSYYEDQYDVAKTFFADNKEIVDSIMALQDMSSLSEEEYLKQMEYWMTKSFLIRNVSIINSSVINNDDKITIPNLSLKNIGSPEIPEVMESDIVNEQVIAQFQAEFLKQTDKLNRLKKQGNKIIRHISQEVQKTMMSFAEYYSKSASVVYTDEPDIDMSGDHIDYMSSGEGEAVMGSYLIIDQAMQVEDAVNLYKTNNKKYPVNLIELSSGEFDYLEGIYDFNTSLWKLECSDEKESCVLGITIDKITQTLCDVIEKQRGDYSISWKCSSGSLMYRF